MILLVVSTTGQGEQPSNARVFWKKILRKKLGPKALESLHFAAFGLGDSSYPNYNWAALKLRKRLMQLGAEEILEFGKGDEQHPEGLEGTFVPWAQALYETLLRLYPLENGQVPISEDVLLPPQWLLATRPTSETSPNSEAGSSSDHQSVSGEGYIRVTIAENSRVTPQEHWQDVRHIKMTSPISIDYAPGDVLVIYPDNPAEDVAILIDLMGWQGVADVPVTYQLNPARSESDASISSPPLMPDQSARQTLRSILTKHVDLNAVPRRSFFSTIAHFATDDYQKSRLIEFTKAEFLDELFDYTTRPRRSIIEVFQEFDSIKIPWQWAVVVLPELRGRHFSITSGGNLKRRADGSTVFELLVAIVEYRTVIRKMRRGVCTRYLAGLPKRAQISVSLERRGLGFSDAEDVRPMLMIGPGTGVAPIRSLIWERAQRRGHQTLDDKNLARDILFFGCRNKNADFFFHDEWKQFESKACLEVFAAFSRDQKRKVYVQDVISEYSQRVFEMLDTHQAVVYVCGSSGKMPRAVQEALVEVFEKEGSLSREDAELRLSAMEKSGSYKQETW